MAEKKKKPQSAYLQFDGTSLYFEAVTEESSTFESRVTEHNVETGADVSDHVQEQPVTVTLECFITNHPVHNKQVNEKYGMEKDYKTIEWSVITNETQSKKLDYPKFRKITPTPGGLMQAAGNAIRDAFADDISAQVFGNWSRGTRTSMAEVQSATTPFNAITDTINELDEWRKKAVIGMVITPWKTFESVVITKVTAKRTAATGDAATVSITLRTIRLVEAKLVAAPKPTVIRAAAPKAKGQQPPVAVSAPKEKQSIAYTAENGIPE